jgi:hypothetical protein
MTITVELSDTREDEEIETHADHCPLCHHKIVPIVRWVKSAVGEFGGAELEVVYQCPNADCDKIFIGYFSQNDYAQFRLYRTRPFEPVTQTFPQCIRDISPAFCEIYDQAHKAEKFGLAQVCGVGYRKALEFLIKDYLIRKCPDDRAAIEDKQLGQVIESYVEDRNIKEVAKRAAWLGNDETHYKRRWVDKDLNDLKRLIRLVLHWIEVAHETEEALSSMPAATTR